MAIFKHIYVSSVFGTNAGGSDTSKEFQQTGDITSMTASDVYDNIGSAIAGCTPSDGDTVYVCNNHSASYDNGTSVTFNVNGTEAGVGLRLISVDNTNVDQYLPGASDKFSDSADDRLYDNNGLWAGIDSGTNDNTVQAAGTLRYWTFQDMTLSAESSTDYFISLLTDGGYIKLVNVYLDVTGTVIIQTAFTMIGGSTIEWLGGGTGTLNRNITNLVNSGINGGYTVLMEGVDLTGVVGTLLNISGALAQDKLLVQCSNCILDPAMTTLHSTLELPQHEVKLINTDQTSTDNLHRFYMASGSGHAKNNDSVYVTANPGFFEETDKSSIQVITTSLCSHVHPFTFKLPAKYADLSNSASDKISINICTDFSIDDTEIAFFMMYPDGTTQVQANWISSGATAGTGNYGTSPLSADGTTLNTIGALAAGDWTGEPPSPTFYLVELDTAATGAAAGVEIRVEVYKPSIAGTTGSYLYIDPVLAVGT